MGLTGWFGLRRREETLGRASRPGSRRSTGRRSGRSRRSVRSKRNSQRGKKVMMQMLVMLAGAGACAGPTSKGKMMS